MSTTLDDHQPRRFQCRHVFTGGNRCGSPSLRHKDFCFYHHTARRPVPRCPQDSTPRGRRRSAITLPNPEDRSAIQHSIGQVLNKLAGNELDARRAGLLLYGLQIASLNLPRQGTPEDPVNTVEEVIFDEEHGFLAPVAEVSKQEKKRSVLQELLDTLENLESGEAEQPVRDTTVPRLQAVAVQLTRAVRR